MFCVNHSSGHITFAYTLRGGIKRGIVECDECEQRFHINFPEFDKLQLWVQHAIEDYEKELVLWL